MMSHWVDGMRIHGLGAAPAVAGATATTKPHGEDDEDPDDMVGFYFRRGVGLLPLDATGDCLLDQMCVISGQATTPMSRLALRIELAEVMCENVENQLFLQAMGNLEEFTRDEVERA